MVKVTKAIYPFMQETGHADIKDCPFHVECNADSTGTTLLKDFIPSVSHRLSAEDVEDERQAPGMFEFYESTPKDFHVLHQGLKLFQMDGNDTQQGATLLQAQKAGNLPQTNQTSVSNPATTSTYPFLSEAIPHQQTMVYLGQPERTLQEAPLEAVVVEEYETLGKAGGHLGTLPPPSIQLPDPIEKSYQPQTGPLKEEQVELEWIDVPNPFGNKEGTISVPVPPRFSAFTKEEKIAILSTKPALRSYYFWSQRPIVDPALSRSLREEAIAQARKTPLVYRQFEIGEGCEQIPILDLEAPAKLQELWKAENRPHGKWTNIGPRNIGGRITCLAVDPIDGNHVWAGAAEGGVWESANGGMSWKPLFDKQPILSIGAIAVGPIVPSTGKRVLYVGTGESTSNWNTVAGDGVFRSDDGGKTWITNQENKFPGTRIHSISIHPGNHLHVLVSSQDLGLFYSEKGGDSWNPAIFPGGRPRHPPGATTWDLARNPINPNIVYLVTTGNSGVSLVYVSNDSGKNWQETSSKLTFRQRVVRGAIAITRKRHNSIYVSHTFLERGRKCVVIHRHPLGGLQQMGPKPVIEETTPWQKGDIDPPISEKKKVPSSPGVGVKTDPSEEKASSQGIGWEMRDVPWDKVSEIRDVAFLDWTHAFAIDPVDEDIFFVGNLVLWRTTNKGRTWENAGQQPGATASFWFDRMGTPDSVHADIHAIAYAPHDPDPTVEYPHSNRIYIGTDGGVYRSDDKGNTWKKVNFGLVVTQFFTTGVAPTAPALVGGGTQDNGNPRALTGLTYKISKYGDGGTFISSPDNHAILYETNNQTAVFRSYNYGIQDDPKPGQNGIHTKEMDKQGGWWDWPIVFDPRDSRILYVGVRGVFQSLDEGNTWHQISTYTIIDTKTGAPQKRVGSFRNLGRVRSLAISSDGRTLYAGMEGRAIIFRGSPTTSPESPSGWNWEPLNINDPWGNPHVAEVYQMDIAPNGELYVALKWKVGLRSRGEYEGQVYRLPQGGNSRDFERISNDAVFKNNNVFDVKVDPWNPRILYASTETDVFAGTFDPSAGVHRWVWGRIGPNLPKVVCFQMDVNQKSGLLRVATNGRGIWEIPVGPDGESPDFMLYLRDHPLDLGRGPSEIGLVDPSRPIPKHRVSLERTPTKKLYWWESPDIRLDNGRLDSREPGRHKWGEGPRPLVSPNKMISMDGVTFDVELIHDNVLPNSVFYAYVQVHNRGPEPLNKVVVRAFSAAPSVGFEPVPPDFWSKFEDVEGPIGMFTPMGKKVEIDRLEPATPQIVRFTGASFPLPQGVPGVPGAILVVASYSQDQKTSLHTPVRDLKETQLYKVIPKNRQVALRNIQVAELNAKDRSQPIQFNLIFINGEAKDQPYDVVFEVSELYRDGSLYVKFPSSWFLPNNASRLLNFSPYPHTSDLFVASTCSGVAAFQGALFKGRAIHVLPMVFLLPGSRPSSDIPLGDRPFIGDENFQVPVYMRNQRGEIVGGCTYEIRINK